MTDTFTRNFAAIAREVTGKELLDLTAADLHRIGAHIHAEKARIQAETAALQALLDQITDTTN